MKKAIVTVGPSCSGKSTYAEELVKHNPKWVEVNRDRVRFDMFCGGVRDWRLYKFNKNNEQKVTEYCHQQIVYLAENGLNVICSDTNLNAKYRNALIEQLEGLGYEVEIKEFDVPLEELWKRDAFRQNGVGREVIYNQWKQWNEYKGRKTYTPDPTLAPCVIADVDGTIAEKSGRSPFDWSRVSEDKPISTIMDVVDGLYSEGYAVVFLSGRDGVCYEDTKKWLEHYFQFPIELYMRGEGDMRKDWIVKEELFWNNVADEYNVKLVIDDHPQVIRNTWLPLGIKTLTVSDPWVEF